MERKLNEFQGNAFIQFNERVFGDVRNRRFSIDGHEITIDEGYLRVLRLAYSLTVSFDNNSTAGSVSVCTMKSGCQTNLTNSGIYEMVGVAMDKKGNCWASAYNTQFLPTLTYFAKCKGAGVAVTGYQNTSPGGLDIDDAGNLVAIDTSANNTGALVIYSDCKPACNLVGGPFSLHGETFWGYLNQKSTAFATANYVAGEIDVYRYRTTALTYLYSFSNGLNASFSVKGAAYNPRSKE